MGWIELPPYFCAASKTGCDVAQQYMENPVGTLSDNKFLPWEIDSEDVCTLPKTAPAMADLCYIVKVYMDDYLGLAIPTTQEHLRHAANAVMNGIHDVFPADANDKERRTMARRISWASHLMETKRL
jgi:hypothetical protein